MDRRIATYDNVSLVTHHSPECQIAPGRAMIAHQGGWDEILLVLGPIAVIIGLLVVARKRVGAKPPPPKIKR